MKQLIGLLVLMNGIYFSSTAQAQHDFWPKTINTADGAVIKIYEPQPESFTGNILKTRSAVSLLSPGKSDPIFGTFWAVETVETDRDSRSLNIVATRIPNIKFASSQDDATSNMLKSTLETQIPQMGIVLPLDEVLAALAVNTEEKKLSKDLNTTAPHIIYTEQPSILVLIDGAPQLQKNNDWGVEAVVNTPFTLVKNTDGQYYLYGGNHWYAANEATGPFHYIREIPENLNKVQQDVDNANTNEPGYTTTQDPAAISSAVPNVIVSTTPAELVQSSGNPNLTPIDGTALSYVSNSGNDIFFHNDNKLFYVLLSGRWYQSPSLQGNWQYIASNALPPDFAKIPEGSPKDNVLASVGGTPAAREAVLDAQVPQTAKVDRQAATTSVNYDGEPRFDEIQGTNLRYAINTPNSVIYSHGRYFTVDNGVWFESGFATGPWVVCIERPDEIEMIPASYPVYNMKYVYIYDVQPNWVYMGYTPGYLNTYVYGPTVVYGTGYYYRPWHGGYYIPRPFTWGFSMHYNPWLGWSLGFGYRTNWFHLGYAESFHRGWNGWRGGWWGPAVYHPPFRNTEIRSYGYYGNRPAEINRYGDGANRQRNLNYTNNIYNYRRDVITVNNTRIYNNNIRPGGNQQNNNGTNNRTFPASENGRNNANPPFDNRANGQQNNQYNRNGQQPAPAPNNRQLPSITTDRDGNVYQRNNPGNNSANHEGNNAGNNAGNNPGNVNNRTNAPAPQPAPNNPNERNTNNNSTNNTSNNNGQPRNNQQPVPPPTPVQQNQGQQGQWTQRQQGGWKPVANPQTNMMLDRQLQMHERGQTRVQNFQSNNNARQGNGGGNNRPPSNGGGRPSNPNPNHKN